ncbi:ATP-binding protein [Falsiroseomonas sp.]|uniref:ATP-binding protein n=1 Tax=Falsiroseomonas sp. TaxID=2870721 RepID=UPI003F707DC2
MKTEEAWVIGWPPHPPSKAAIIGFVAAVLWACGLLYTAEVVGDWLIEDALTDAEHRAEGMSRAAEQFALRTLGDARVPHALAQRWAELAPDAPQAARAELEIMMNRRLMRHGQSVQYIVIFDAKGEVAWASPGAPQAMRDPDFASIRNHPFFLDHRDRGIRETVATSRISSMTGAIILPFSGRLDDSQGNFAGVLYAPLTSSSLSAALATVDSRAGDVASIVGDDGYIVARSAGMDGMVGQFVLPPNTTVSDANFFRTTQTTGAVSGRPVTVARRRVEGTQLVAVSTVDMATATAEAAFSRNLTRALAVGIGGSAFATVIVFFVMQRRRSREMAAEAWRAGRTEIERLLDGLPAVIFLRVIDKDGRSEQLYRTGDQEGVSGWPRSVLAPDGDLSHLAEPGTDFSELLGAMVLAEEAVKVWRIRQPDGSLAWLRATLRLLERRPDGSSLVVGYIVNITAERDAEARLMMATRMASLGEMGAGIAHELKQPLTAISLAADVAAMLLRKGDYERLPQRLDRIIEQTQRGAAIIENLRRFARGVDESEQPGIVSLDQAIANALAMIGNNLRADEVGIEVVNGEPPPLVVGHSIALEQVIVNILFNARDALLSQESGQDRQIRIDTTGRDGNFVILEISDNGTGIDPAIIGKVFDPFFTTKAPDKGTGLGLSICDGIVQSMGGRIQARNLPRGTCFTIMLPGHQPDDVAPNSAGDNQVEHAA